MSDDSDIQTIELGQLADEFVDRIRKGERPTVREYVDRCPRLAPEIRELFPTLAMMEEAGDGDGGTLGGFGETTPAPGELKRLGDYRILREIGRGGMGVVYEAEQESLGRHVALKVLPHYAMMDPQQLKRFRRESRAAAQLHHSNIVPVFGVGEADGVHYYGMQFIQGLGLDEVLAEVRIARGGEAAPQSVRSAVSEAAELVPPSSIRDTAANSSAANSSTASSAAARPPTASSSAAGKDSSSITLGPRDGGSSSAAADYRYFRGVARIGVQVADALAYAHGQGVIHRDVKPSNLLLDKEGTAWVTDFGLAKTDGEDLTHTGDLVGTLRYMAPERFRGWSDVRSDIYSLGLTLYEMVTLRPAFQSSDRAEIIRSVTLVEPPRPRRLDPHVPRDLETIILKATDKEPHHRYQSAAEMREDLQLFLDDKPIVARRTPWQDRALMWGRRNPLAATLTATVILLLFASTVGSWMYARELKHSLSRAVDAEQSERSAHRLASRRLYDSYFAQAQAIRLSGRPGQRLDGLTAVERAAKLLDPLELGEEARRDLRNEAIACLALTDFRVDRRWKADEYGERSPHRRWALDPAVEHYAREIETGEISIRQLSDNREVRRLSGIGPMAEWNSRPYLKFSPNGRYLAEFAFGADDVPRVQVFDWRADKALFQEPVVSTGLDHWAPIEFTADSKTFLYFADGGKLVAYEIETGETKQWQTKERSAYLRASPDGKLLALDQQWIDITLLDLTTGEVVKRMTNPASVREVAWSHDGKLLAAACADNRTYVWRLDNTSQPLAVCSGHTSSVRHVAFNDNRLLVTTAWDQTTRVWNAVTGRQLMRLDLTGGARFSEDQRWIGFEYAGHDVGRVEIHGGDECHVLSGHAPDRTSAVCSLQFSADGSLLVSASRFDGFRIWRVRDQHCLYHLKPYDRNTTARFSPDGRFLYTSGWKGMDRWTIRSDHALTHFELDERVPILRTEEEAWLSFSLMDENKAAVGFIGAGQGTVIDLETREELFPLRDDDWMNHLVATGDGQWLACGSWHVSHWNVWDDEGRLVHREETAGAGVAVSFSPDGKWLTTQQADDVVFRRTGVWSPEFRVSRYHPGISNVAFSDDMRWVAVTDLYEVKLYDFHTREFLASLSGPDGAQLSTSHPNAAYLTFSPDNRYLAVGTCETSVHLWDLHLLRKRLREYELDWRDH